MRINVLKLIDMNPKQKNNIVITLLGGALIILTSVYLSFLLIFYRGWLWKNDGRYVITLLFSPLIFGVSAILLISFLFFNKKVEVVGKQTISLLSTTFVLIILLTTIITRNVISKEYEEHHSFTTEKWRAAQELDRWHYIPSLEKKHEIVGKTYDDIITLLSEPNEETVTTLTYYLGYGRGIINIDPLYYYITLNEARIVTAAAVYQS